LHGPIDYIAITGSASSVIGFRFCGEIFTDSLWFGRRCSGAGLGSVKGCSGTMRRDLLARVRLSAHARWIEAYLATLAGAGS